MLPTMDNTEAVIIGVSRKLTLTLTRRTPLLMDRFVLLVVALMDLSGAVTVVVGVLELVNWVLRDFLLSFVFGGRITVVVMMEYIGYKE
jgi:hypothetical protein